MECLHPANGVFHRDAGWREFPVMFLLGGCEFGVVVFLGLPGSFVRQVYIGFTAIIRFRPLEAEVEPHIHFIEPFRSVVEYLFLGYSCGYFQRRSRTGKGFVGGGSRRQAP